ncbi:hypothetical protein HanIR_Chr06g0297701 [Helianthus annuus]|nr:hypothetical protein HanIR_Chr06g0297701 [Helianthus annuus]
MILEAYHKFHRCRFVLMLVICRRHPLQGLIHVAFFCRVFFIEVLRDRDNSYGFEMNLNNQMLSDARGKSKFMLN